MNAQKIEFRERERCPGCGETHHEEIWSGRFSDTDVSNFIKQFQYSVDTGVLLGDEKFKLVRCTSCKLMYHRHVVVDSVIPQVYSEWTDEAQVKRFEAAHGHSDAYVVGLIRLKFLLGLRTLLVGLKGEAPRLLDFGCGGGQDIAQAKMLGFNAVGIDVSLTKLDHANRMGCRVYSSLDAFDDHFDEKVHAIMMVQVLEHLMEPAKILAELRDRLLPGGILYVAVPNCSETNKPTNFAEFSNVHPIEHVNAFTPHSLTATVERAGYSRISSPTAIVATDLTSTARGLARMLYSPETTDQFFRRD